MKKTLAVIASAAIPALAHSNETEILKPDWSSGYHSVEITLSNGRKIDTTAKIFGRQDVEIARNFGSNLVKYHNSKSTDERIINDEAYTRFGNTASAGFFTFEAKVGFSLEVRRENGIR